MSIPQGSILYVRPGHWFLFPLRKWCSFPSTRCANISFTFPQCKKYKFFILYTVYYWLISHKIGIPSNSAQNHIRTKLHLSPRNDKNASSVNTPAKASWKEITLIKAYSRHKFQKCGRQRMFPQPSINHKVVTSQILNYHIWTYQTMVCLDVCPTCRNA